jgi:hypothetical protein
VLWIVLGSSASPVVLTKRINKRCCCCCECCCCWLSSLSNDDAPRPSDKKSISSKAQQSWIPQLEESYDADFCCCCCCRRRSVRRAHALARPDCVAQSTLVAVEDIVSLESCVHSMCLPISLLHHASNIIVSVFPPRQKKCSDNDDIHLKSRDNMTI